jgi:hypothetical protein
MTIYFPKSLPGYLLIAFLIFILVWRSGWAYADENIPDVLIVGAGLSGLSSV